VRATKFGRTLRFQSKTEDKLNWTYHDVPLPEDLLTLQQIIARKYQRRRASAEDLASVDKLVTEHAANE